MKKSKLIIYGILFLIVGIFIYLALPSSTDYAEIAEKYNNLSNEDSNFKSKKQFYTFVDNIIMKRELSNAKTDADILSSEAGQRLADAAKLEYDYYIGMNLVGGARYWYWYDLLVRIDREGKVIAEYYPLGSQYVVGGWYEKSAIRNRNDAQWCDMFVSCVAQSAGFTKTGSIIPGSSVQSSFKQFADAGAECVILNTSYCFDNKESFVNRMGDSIVGVQFVDTYEPRPGDLIVYSNQDSNGRLSHIGIVYGVTEEYITTVEGNTGGSRVQTSKVEMIDRKRDSKYIAGFIRPNY